MSQKYGWVLRIIPEDDRYRQIANGFIRSLPETLQKYFEVAPIAGGWTKALAAIDDQGMDRFKERHLLVLIDFDGEGDVRQRAVDKALSGKERTFCLGPKDEAEDLEYSLNGNVHGATKFQCGRKFASVDFVCPDTLWRDEQLDTENNRKTLDTLCALVRLKVLGRSRF